MNFPVSPRASPWAASAAALATAGLVGVTGTSASAAPVSTTYTCSDPARHDFPVPVTVDIALLPQHRAGRLPGPGRAAVSFKSNLTVPDAVQPALDRRRA